MPPRPSICSMWQTRWFLSKVKYLGYSKRNYNIRYCYRKDIERFKKANNHTVIASSENNYNYLNQ